MNTPPTPLFLEEAVVAVCAMVLSFQVHAGVALCRSSLSLMGRILTQTLRLSSDAETTPSSMAAGLRLGLIMVDLDALRLPKTSLRGMPPLLGASPTVFEKEVSLDGGGRTDGAGMRGIVGRGRDRPDVAGIVSFAFVDALAEVDERQYEGL